MRSQVKIIIYIIYHYITSFPVFSSTNPANTPLLYLTLKEVPYGALKTFNISGINLDTVSAVTISKLLGLLIYS